MRLHVHDSATGTPASPKVLEWLESYGLENGWIQPLEAGAADYYRPDFSNPSVPFADARDFLESI